LLDDVPKMILGLGWTLFSKIVEILDSIELHGVIDAMSLKVFFNAIIIRYRVSK
jgi:hypothetical protein